MLQLLTINPLAFLLGFGGLIVAITIHEFAHAWMADHLGDPTPRVQGRVTLNPLAHLDPIGTLAILFTRFGWGRPVEFDPYNLENPVRDAAMIALAGPASNILLATLLALVVPREILTPVWQFATEWLIQINVILAIFNLVPIYPLDGSKILLAVLPRDKAYQYEELMEQYGFIILLLMILPLNGTSLVSQLIGPAIAFVLQLLGVSA